VELALAGTVLALLLAQMAVGEVQWREALPWWLVLVHVTLATAVWVVVTALASRIVLRRRARLP
jgi:heme A synthase